MTRKSGEIGEAAMAIWVAVLLGVTLITLTRPLADWPNWKDSLWSAARPRSRRSSLVWWRSGSLSQRCDEAQLMQRQC